MSFIQHCCHWPLAAYPDSLHHTATFSLVPLPVTHASPRSPSMQQQQQQSASQQSRPPPQQQQAGVTAGAPQQKAQHVLSSELIQSYLDQNQLFIAAIVENQSMGKLQAAMEYQIKLQQNLLFLASLADQTGGGHTQPSTPSNSGQQSR